MTYSDWLTYATQLLTEKLSQDPYLNAKLDANLLLQAVTKRSRSAIFAFGETELNKAEQNKLNQMLERRTKGEPMAYILGEKEFWSLPLKVSSETLIPRPDTERLVEVALDWANKRLENQENLQILDLGTGTGAIALALASELKQKAQVLGVDFKPEVVVLAESNRQMLQIENARFQQSDWFSTLGNQQFDLIVSNPPYIDAQNEHLGQGDVRFEPLSALVANDAGYADLRHIIELASSYLNSNGALLLEHGWQQGEKVRSIFQENHWEMVETVRDYGDNERVTLGFWKK